VKAQAQLVSAHTVEITVAQVINKGSPEHVTAELLQVPGFAEPLHVREEEPLDIQKPAWQDVDATLPKFKPFE
jgi:hypothetical protein